MLNKMGAAIEGIGSNVMHVHGVAKLGGCEHTVSPDHIEIASFMALAGVTGGELDIDGCVAEDLRMIRMVVPAPRPRLLDARGRHLPRPGRPEAARPARRRRLPVQGRGRPVARVPGRPHDRSPSRSRRSPRARVLIFEKMFENRLFFVDKLISMGAEITICDPHRAIVIGPRQLRGARVSSPDIRAGMAMLIAAVCAQGTSEIHNVRDIDRGYERIDERLLRAGRADRARPGVIHPIPSGTRDVLPDELRELRAITDGMRGVFDARGYGEVATPALEYESVLTRGDTAAADPAYRLFDEHGNVLVLRLGHDDPDRPRRGHALPDVADPAAVLLHRARLPGGQASTAASRARSCRRGSSSSARPGRTGTAEAVSVLCAALDAAGLVSYRVGLGDASLFPRALERAGRARHAAAILNELASRDLVGLERELTRGRRASSCSTSPATRGGVEVVPEGEPLREASTSCSRPTWPSA